MDRPTPPESTPFGPEQLGIASAQVETLRAELDTLRASVEVNDHEIDALQVRVAEGERPWYRSAQSLVAVVALLLSLVTTLTSGYWAKTQGDAAELRLRQQQIHDAKTELRGLLQALSELTRQSQEVQTIEDPYLAQLLMSGYAAETSLLTNQAYAVAQTIPEHVTSTESLSIARQLGDLGDFQKAEPLLARSILTAETAFDRLSAARTYAIFLFGKKDIANGQHYMRQALAVWDQFPHIRDQNPLWPMLEDLITYIRWAEAEAATGNCAAAEEQAKAAETLLAELTPGLDPRLVTQYDQMRAFVGACGMSDGSLAESLPTFPPLLPSIATFVPTYSATGIDSSWLPTFDASSLFETDLDADSPVFAPTPIVVP